MSEEARLHDRIPCMDPVSVVASPSSPPLRLRALNVSQGGICLQTNHPFRRGDRVGLRLATGGRELAVPVSEVAWVVREVKGSSRVPAVGLRFINLRPEQRQELRGLLEKLEEMPADIVIPRDSVSPAAPARAALPEAVPMHTEPSLPPLDTSDPPESTPPPRVRARKASAPAVSQPEPSLGPMTDVVSGKPTWEFSTPPSLKPHTGSPSLALAGGLLVVGTLAGVIFGVMDQRGQPAAAPGKAAVASAPAAAEPAPAPAEPAPAEPAPVAVAAPAAAPVPTPAPAPVAVAAPTPAPVPAAKAAPEPRSAQAEPAGAPRRPGFVTMGAPTVVGKELVVPVRGVRGVERHFTLKGPDRVVVDLKADGFEGSREFPGKGRVLKIRLGSRPGGVRLVLDVKDARVAASARVEKRQGVLAVVFPLQ